MKADMSRLKDFAKNKNLSFAELAKMAGMDISTFYRKVKSEGENFTIGEVHSLVDASAMSREDAILIFLPDNSHKCEFMECV